jgi:hypothetical protein
MAVWIASKAVSAHDIYCWQPLTGEHPTIDYSIAYGICRNTKVT